MPEVQTLVGTRSFSHNGQGTFSIEYHRMERETEDGTIYGVRLKKYVVENGERILEDNAPLPLTDNIGHINRIIKSLIEGAVTNEGLLEVIDYIYDKTLEA